MTLAEVFAPLPAGLREQLLDEYDSLVTNFKQGRWAQTSHSGGRFCEVVYTILKGYPDSYPATASKPPNFPEACAGLKNKDASVPASIRLLIPRVLPGIYDIRNTRGVAHVGDISTHGMDASFVLPACSWVLAELVRVFTSSQPTAGAKSFSVEEGQALVDELTKQPVLVVWQDGKVKRVLDITLNLYDQIVLLAAAGPISKDDVRRATEHYTDDYLETVLRGLHTRRLIEFRRDTGIVTLTSLGAAKASSLATAWRKGQSID